VDYEDSALVAGCPILRLNIILRGEPLYSVRQYSMFWYGERRHFLTVEFGAGEGK